MGDSTDSENECPKLDKCENDNNQTKDFKPNREIEMSASSSSLSNLSTELYRNERKITKSQNLSRVSVTNQVSNFTLEAQYFLEVLSTFRLRCNCLDSELSDVLYQIVDSISLFLDGDPCSVSTSKETISYINFKRNTFKKQYFCDICQVIITDTSKALRMHLHGNQHHQGMRVLRNGNDEEINDLKKQRRLENIISENPEVVAKILKRNMRYHKKKEEQIQNLPKKAKVFILGDFSDFLQKSYNQAKTLNATSVFNKISISLYTTLKNRFPTMKVLFYGSRVCGLANESSDLNIIVETGIIPRYNPTADVTLDILNDIKYLLKKKSDTWRQCIVKEDNCKLSLSVRNIEENIYCDILIHRYISHLETLLIIHLIENQPIFQDVCLFLKQWMKYTGLNQHFTSYMTTWLVVFAFQIQRHLPPIQFLQVNTPPIAFGPWQINFTKIALTQFGINKIPRDYDNTSHILKRFFQFYSTFDFKKLVICPFLGYSIDRNAFNSFATLQPPYYAFILKNPSQGLPLKSSVCFQNPLEQNINMAENISEGGVKLFQMYCLQSMKILMNKKNPS